MLKYKKILVPYDGSDHAKKAVQQASDLAAAGDGTKIYIASVCNMVSAMSNFDQVSIAEGCLTTKLLEDRESQCQKDIAEAKSMIPKDIPVEELYEVGSPGPVLLNMAEDNGIDLTGCTTKASILQKIREYEADAAAAAAIIAPEG